MFQKEKLPQKKLKCTNSRMIYWRSRKTKRSQCVQYFFLNLGVMTELPYIEKMYAACVVADYILRHMVSHGKQQKEQTNLHQHPFSVLLDKNHKQLRLGFNVRQEFKQGYESLRTNLSNQLKLPSYDSFY